MTTAEFLEALFADVVSPERRIAVFTMPTRRTAFFATAEEATEYALRRAGSLDVYFGVGLIHGEPKGRGKLSDVAAVAGLHADIDLPCGKRADKPLPATLDEVASLWAPFGMEPTLVVLSGHGVHVYWLFREPWVFESDKLMGGEVRVATAPLMPAASPSRTTEVTPRIVSARVSNRLSWARPPISSVR